jgi:hypothetical protein
VTVEDVTGRATRELRWLELGFRIEGVDRRVRNLPTRIQTLDNASCGRAGRN